MDYSKLRRVELARLGTGVFGGIYGEGGSRHYGGAQRWFEHGWQRDTCCGVVAAANIMAYMAETDNAYRPLYGQPAMGEHNFLQHQKQLLQYLHPPRLRLPGKGLKLRTVSLGILTTGRFKRGVLRYAASKGVRLKAVSKQKWLNTKSGTLDMVYAALRDDRPVAMLVHYNKGLKKHSSGQCFEKHWVTITGLQPEENTAIITVSSWRREYRLDLEAAWDGSSYIGFVYFT